MTYFQKPNPPSIVAGISFILSLLTQGMVMYITLTICLIASIYWSYLEITSGINNFRKALGWTGLVVIILYFFYRIT